MHIRIIGLAAVMLSAILLLTALVSGMTGHDGLRDNNTPAHDEKPAAHTLVAAEARTPGPASGSR